MEVQETSWWGEVCGRCASKLLEVRFTTLCKVSNAAIWSRPPNMDLSLSQHQWTLLIETRVSSHLTWAILSWHGMLLPFTTGFALLKIPNQNPKRHIAAMSWWWFFTCARSRCLPLTTGQPAGLKDAGLGTAPEKGSQRSPTLKIQFLKLFENQYRHGDAENLLTFLTHSDVVFCVVPSPYCNKAQDGVKDVKVATHSVPNTQSSPSALVWKPSGESIEAYRTILNPTFTSQTDSRNELNVPILDHPISTLLPC